MKTILNSLLILVFLSSITYAISDKDIVLYCPFDDVNGDITKDLASGLEGKVNGPKLVNKGKFGGALEFAKSDDYVLFPADNVLDITENITMEAWVLPNAVQDDSNIMGRRSAPNVGGYCMQWTAGKFEMWLNIGGWQGTRDKQKIIPKPGEWHHIACVYDGKEEMQYVDGELDIKFSIPGKIASIAEPFRVGQAQTGLSSMLGLIDEVAVYKRALTQEEIKKDMTQSVFTRAFSVSPTGSLATAWGSIKKN